MAKNVENCVFQHKLILIANKTLLDTVLPTQHWTLKAALKGGCSCCAPEEDEGEEDMGALASKLNLTRPGVYTMKSDQPSTDTSSKNRGYVDGKTTFAFDPTKF